MCAHSLLFESECATMGLIANGERTERCHRNKRIILATMATTALSLPCIRISFGYFFEVNYKDYTSITIALNL